MTIGDAGAAIFGSYVEVISIRTKIASIVKKFIPEKTLIAKYFVDIIVCKVVSAIQTPQNRAG